MLFQDQGIPGLPGLTNASDLPGQLAKLQADAEAFQVRFYVHSILIFYSNIAGIRNSWGSWQSSRRMLKRFRWARAWGSSLDTIWAPVSFVVTLPRGRALRTRITRPCPASPDQALPVALPDTIF